MTDKFDRSRYAECLEAKIASGTDLPCDHFTQPIRAEAKPQSQVMGQGWLSLFLRRQRT